MARTTIVLLVIAVALGAYIALFERGSISSGERERRKGSALSEFVRNRVEKLELQRKGVTVVIARDVRAEPEDDASLWRVVAPYEAKADQEAVDTLLGELEWLDGRRRLEGIGPDDRKRFGLESPRYRLWFTVGKQRVPVTVGGDSPRNDGVYVSAGEPDVAYVVGKELVESLNQEPGHYHTKELYDDDVLFATSVGLELRGAQGERTLRRRDDWLWEFGAGGAGLASAPAVQSIVEGIRDLHAQRFVAQDVKDLARYGLAQPRSEVVLNRSIFGDKKDAKGKPVREQVSLRLRAGAPCEGHPGESYLTVDDTRTVNCVADQDLQKLDKALPELREERLLPLEDDAIAGAQLSARGTKLTLRKQDEKWTYEKSGGGPALKGEARPEAVADLWKALRAQKLTRIVEPAPANLARGPGLRVERSDGKPAYEVHTQASGSSELLAKRTNEPVAVAFPASAAELLDPVAARFRPLALRSDAKATPLSIEVRRAGVVERLKRNADNAFAIETPIAAPADGVSAPELARLLGSLEAVRFVADAPAPSHGLAPAKIEIAAEFPATGGKAATPQRLVLRLGALTEGGRFASIDGDSAVFVASARLSDLASFPLVSRTLLATPLEQLRTVEIERGGRRVRIEGHDGAFQAASGTTVSGEAALALAQALATLRASQTIAYGPSAAEQGFKQPAARVAVTSAGPTGAEASYSIEFGAEIAGGRYARRSDQPVTFVVPNEQFDRLLAAVP